MSVPNWQHFRAHFPYGPVLLDETTTSCPLLRTNYQNTLILTTHWSYPLLATVIGSWPSVSVSELKHRFILYFHHNPPRVCQQMTRHVFGTVTFGERCPTRPFVNSLNPRMPNRAYLFLSSPPSLLGFLPLTRSVPRSHLRRSRARSRLQWWTRGARARRASPRSPVAVAPPWAHRPSPAATRPPPAAALGLHPVGAILRRERLPAKTPWLGWTISISRGRTRGRPKGPSGEPLISPLICCSFFQLLVLTGNFVGHVGWKNIRSRAVPYECVGDPALSGVFWLGLNWGVKLWNIHKIVHLDCTETPNFVLDTRILNFASGKEASRFWYLWKILYVKVSFVWAFSFVSELVYYLILLDGFIWYWNHHI